MRKTGFKRRTFTAQELANIVAWDKAGHKRKKIARAVGRTYHAVCQALYKSNADTKVYRNFATIIDFSACVPESFPPRKQSTAPGGVVQSRGVVSVSAQSDKDALGELILHSALSTADKIRLIRAL